MKSITKRGASHCSLWLPCAVVFVFGCTACKRENEGEHPQTLDPASSQVMSNSAGVGGTPGQSDAVKRAQTAAPAPPASEQAPVQAMPGAQLAPASGARQ